MPTDQATIVIEEILGRSTQGVTEPFICRADNGGIYYVKGCGAGRRSQICEWVAAQLASAFGLPVAPYALAEVPEPLVAAKVRTDIGQLGAGLVFASRQLPHAQELSVTSRGLVPTALATDVLVFDWWVRNEDRKLTALGGNPNLLWNTADDELMVIDHNQAFDRAFGVTDFLQSHVFAPCWNTVYADLDIRARYRQRMRVALSELQTVRASIPEAWWWIDTGVPADVSWIEIATCLERCSREDFWNIP